jgi:hypothetical protein
MSDTDHPFPTTAPDHPVTDRSAGLLTTIPVTVRPWVDPLLDRFGHEPRSPYVERFWLPIVGPSGTLLLRRLAEGFDQAPEGYRVELTHIARSLGMGRRDGPSASFSRTLERVASFGFIQVSSPDSLMVRRHLPGLTRRQLQRLPRALRDDHDHWHDERGDDAA